MAIVPPLPPPGLKAPLAIATEAGTDGAEQFGIPVSELLIAALDPPVWLINGYIQEQSINILGGPPNSGKTLLAFDWCAKAVAKGKFVFIAENEGSQYSLQQRLLRSCVAAGIPVPPDRYTYRRNMQLDLSNFAKVKEFAKRLEGHDLILLDSLGSLWPGLNENDPEHMSVVAEALKLLCEHSMAALLGVHHTTKAAWKPGERPSLADLRGHGAMAGRIDGAFICRPLERVAGAVKFELYTVKQRDLDYQAPQSVEVTMTGEAATVTLEPLGWKPEANGRARELEQQILVVLPQNEEGALSQNDVCSRVRKAKPDVVAALKLLYRAQRISQDFKGRFFRMKVYGPSDSGTGRPSSRGGSKPYYEPEDKDQS